MDAASLGAALACPASTAAMSHIDTAPIIRYHGSDRPVLAIPVSGELNSSTAPQFERVLEAAANEFDREVDLVLDFSGVTELTSVCLGLLVNYVGEWGDGGRRFLIVAISPVALEVFQLLGLTALFPRKPDVNTALAECGVLDPRSGRPSTW